jgi:hypothetical protein
VIMRVDLEMTGDLHVSSTLNAKDCFQNVACSFCTYEYIVMRTWQVFTRLYGYYSYLELTS